MNVYSSSCGTVALMVLGHFFLIFADHGAADFTLSKTFESANCCRGGGGPRAIKQYGICVVSLDICLHSSVLACLMVIVSTSLL